MNLPTWMVVGKIYLVANFDGQFEIQTCHFREGKKLQWVCHRHIQNDEELQLIRINRGKVGRACTKAVKPAKAFQFGLNH